MTTLAQLSDGELADVLAEVATVCDTADRAAGFFLSRTRRRSASADLLAARRLRRPLAEEWVLRAAGRAVGAPVTRIDLVWSALRAPGAVVTSAIDDEGVDHSAVLVGDGAPGDVELVAALRCLSQDWRGEPDRLTLAGGRTRSV